MTNHKARVYVSVPVDMLTREQTEKLRTEVAGVLDPETQEPVFNNAVFDAPDDDPQRTWKHLSRAMTLIGECDAVLFARDTTCTPTSSVQSNLRRPSALARDVSTHGAMPPALCSF